MLTHLRISNIAIIEEAELTPTAGLNVLTGETGAGKSIIVGAAGLLRGGRASSEMIRAGQKEAAVEALFDLEGLPRVAAQVEAAGFPLDGPELLVRRVIARGGRGRAYINGALCTVSGLGQIARQLLDISGQHEHQLLSDRTTHRQLLDALGLPSAVQQAMATAFAALRALVEEQTQLGGDQGQQLAREEFLRFQLAELQEAALQPGEDMILQAELRRLQRAADLIQAAQSGEATLYSAQGAVTDQLAQVGRQLNELSGDDPALDPLARQLEEARVLVEDAAMSLRHYAAGLELDPGGLRQVEQRLDLIHRLQRKHGPSVDQILEQQEQMEAELAQLQGREQRLGQLAEALKAARLQARQAAQQTTAARQKAAQALSKKVTGFLAGLKMEGARMEVSVQPRAVREDDPPEFCFGKQRLGPQGWDSVEFLMATNPGEPAQPLARIASGGELSRVMLALRRVLGEHDPVATSIFDEVDAGIGGMVADVVGQNLAQVARHRQVICVTHLPQVAAYADSHFHVGKGTAKGRTRATVTALDAKARVEELARLLGGAQTSPTARANAQELLRNARKRGHHPSP